MNTNFKDDMSLNTKKYIIGNAKVNQIYIDYQDEFVNSNVIEIEDDPNYTTIVTASVSYYNLEKFYQYDHYSWLKQAVNLIINNMTEVNEGFNRKKVIYEFVLLLIGNKENNGINDLAHMIDLTTRDYLRRQIFEGNYVDEDFLTTNINIRFAIKPNTSNKIHYYSALSFIDKISAVIHINYENGVHEIILEDEFTKLK